MMLDRLVHHHIMRPIWKALMIELLLLIGGGLLLRRYRPEADMVEHEPQMATVGPSNRMGLLQTQGHKGVQ